MKLLKKLTIKDMGIGKADILKLVMSDKNKSHHIADIWGAAGDVKNGESSMGPWVRFLGSFRGISHIGEKPEKFASATCHLPGAAEETTLAMLRISKGIVEFAFSIFAKYDATAATSYVYEVTPLMEADANDPAARIELAIAQKLALPAPEPAPEPEKAKGKAKA